MAPCTIEAEGIYTLGANIDLTNVAADETTGLQIGIRIAPGVVNASINCDAFSISHNGGYDSTAIGIYGSAVSNVSVVNCNIYGRGLQYGVAIDNMNHPESAGVRISHSAMSASMVGIQVRSKKTYIESNFVHMLGRQTVDPNGSTGGIVIHGAGGDVTITGNRIYRLENAFSNDVFGISCMVCYNATIANNDVENNATVAKSWAFLLREGTYTVTANTARNFEYGFGLVAGSSGTLTGTTFENVNKEFAPSSDSDPSNWKIGQLPDVASSKLSACATIIMSPCTIETEGAYTLGANVDVTEIGPDETTGLQIGIKIAPGVANASIDCDIFSISHDGGYDSTAIGIYGSAVSNVSIANCNIHGRGLQYGVAIDNMNHPASMGVRVSNSAVSASLVGIQVRSRKTSIENNFVHMLGRQTRDPNGFTGGIVVHGAGGEVAIRGNRIYRLENAFNDEVFGISCAGCYNATIANNDVENNVLLDKSWAFWIREGTYSITANKAKNFEYGFGLVAGSSGTLTGTTLENVDNAFTATPTDDLSKWKIRQTRNIAGSKNSERANRNSSPVERARRARASSRPSTDQQIQASGTCKAQYLEVGRSHASRCPAG